MKQNLLHQITLLLVTKMNHLRETATCAWSYSKIANKVDGTGKQWYGCCWSWSSNPRLSLSTVDNMCYAVWNELVLDDQIEYISVINVELKVQHSFLHIMNDYFCTYHENILYKVLVTFSRNVISLFSLLKVFHCWKCFIVESCSVFLLYAMLSSH